MDCRPDALRSSTEPMHEDLWVIVAISSSGYDTDRIEIQLIALNILRDMNLSRYAACPP